MKITKAEFVTSNTDYKKCPAPVRPEYAFIGRSNVGKSSLINSLCERKSLAKTSATPGKTQLINHFNINDAWYLVDLPGYGYARTSKTNRAAFAKIITSYIEGRENLTNLFVLVDSRHEPQKIDVEFMAYLAENSIPFSIIMTKMDKLSKEKAKKNIEIYQNILSQDWEELPPMFFSSSETGQGREEILQYIEDINNSIKP
ncbi:MAG: ribosome biogenesis GTP-binding protein YihA/YsxC [Flavobacteriales bacterium]|nr:ribosome biogenesis GTP-binding protein YihA/YsxC [Flavobacteriales bacterium]